MINYWAVLLAAASAFALGGLWYSPAMFLKRWQREAGVDPAKTGRHPAFVFGLAFVLVLIAAYLLARILGPAPALSDAVGTGLIVGVGWVATSYGVNNLFAGRSVTLWAIDAGYHAVKFALFGVILGLWH